MGQDRRVGDGRSRRRGDEAARLGRAVEGRLTLSVTELALTVTELALTVTELALTVTKLALTVTELALTVTELVEVRMPRSAGRGIRRLRAYSGSW
ncbi:hypothetical protein GCM10023087_19700 [Microbacterium rhizosphaerae]